MEQDFLKQEIKQKQKQESNLGKKLKNISATNSTSEATSNQSSILSHNVQSSLVGLASQHSSSIKEAAPANIQHQDESPLGSIKVLKDQLAQDLLLLDQKQDDKEEIGLMIPKKNYNNDPIDSSSIVTCSPTNTTNTTQDHLHQNNTLDERDSKIGFRVQRQASLVDWNSSRVEVKKSLKSHSLVINNHCQSPAQAFLQSLQNHKEDEEFEIGDEIGDYKLAALISNTGNSSVYIATTMLKPKLDIKKENGVYKVCLKITKTRNDNEILIWSSLYHPFILSMYELIEFEKSFIITSEYCKQNLLDFIKYGGDVESNCRKYFSQLASAIDYLHSKMGIIHHDIKLENILVDSNGVKLADFGMAEYYKPITNNNAIEKSSDFVKNYTSLARNKDILCKKNQFQGGSIHYMAPEIIMGTKWSLPSSDIWALGCVFYAMLKKRLPFNDSYMPKLQMLILGVKYDKLQGLEGQLLNGMLCLDLDARWDIKEIIKHEYVLPMEQL